MSTPPPTEISFEEEVLLGFADVIAGNPDATQPLWSEHLTAEQPPGTVGIYLDVWPEDVDSVTITDYTVSDDPSLSDSVLGVQVTIKAARRSTVKAIASDVFSLFHGRQGGMLGAVRLVSARRASGTNTGQDSSERQGRIDNYYLTVHRPSPHRQ